MGDLRISSAVQNLHNNLHFFTEVGLTGLTRHAVEAEQLGRLLATGQLPLAELQALIVKYQFSDPQAFWQGFWSIGLKCQVEVPPLPKIKTKTKAALEQYGFLIIFLPKIKYTDYPDGYIRPNWGKYLDRGQVKHRTLSGCWVAMETIVKPDWDDPDSYPKGYGNGEDPLAQILDLKTRFKVSWDDLHQTHLPKVAKLISVRRQSVRSPSGEEWNLIANVFNDLRDTRGTDLPDLGSTRSWEWSENSCGPKVRLVVGCSGYGGLAGVTSFKAGLSCADCGFRVLVVL